MILAELYLNKILYWRLRFHLHLCRAFWIIHWH